jgi:hypothetical protein
MTVDYCTWACLFSNAAVDYFNTIKDCKENFVVTKYKKHYVPDRLKGNFDLRLEVPREQSKNEYNGLSACSLNFYKITVRTINNIII